MSRACAFTLARACEPYQKTPPSLRPPSCCRERNSLTLPRPVPRPLVKVFWFPLFSSPLRTLVTVDLCLPTQSGQARARSAYAVSELHARRGRGRGRGRGRRTRARARTNTETHALASAPRTRLPAPNGCRAWRMMEVMTPPRADAA
eukprot:598425-Pleurochrysis_carterae.AAC.6